MRILYLTHRLPYAPNRGDRVRAFHVLKLLSSRADVDLVSLVHDREEATHVDDLRHMTATTTVVPAASRLRAFPRAMQTLPTSRPLTHVLLDAPTLDRSLRDVFNRCRPDLVLAYCSGMARFALERPLDDVPFVLDLVDVDSQKWTELAERSAGPLGWVYRREARHLGAFEALAMTRAAATTVVNQREADAARALAPRANIQVIGNGVDLHALRPPAGAAREERVVFCGVMNYRPNEDGAIWLATRVWPLVLAHRPHARLTLVGSNPTTRLQSACRGNATIELTGTVPDVRPFLWRSKLAVAPLQVARGLQNKVLEAFAAGLPVVATPAVADGLPAAVRQACSIAAAPEPFAAAICELLELNDEERSAKVALAAVEELDWTTSLMPLWSLLERAARRDGAPCEQPCLGRIA